MKFVLFDNDDKPSPGTTKRVYFPFSAGRYSILDETNMDECRVQIDATAQSDVNWGETPSKYGKGCTKNSCNKPGKC